MTSIKAKKVILKNRAGEHLIPVVDGGGGLEICDIGTALYIDETKGKRRWLNGQIVAINDNTQAFLKRLKEIQLLHPSLFTTEENWQAVKTLSAFGQVGLFVIDEEAGTIRIPAVVNIQGLFDLQNLGLTVQAGLPNIEGYTYLIGASDSGIYMSKYGGAIYPTQGNAASGKQLASTSNGNPPGQFNFDASNSNPIYGNSDTVQEEAIQYPYFIQVATGSETKAEIINEIELNNPYSFGDSKYSPVALNNISWLKSEGQYNPKAVYTDYYDWLLRIYNGTEVQEGVSVKLVTEEYTDYDWVLNTADETFRLPLLDGSEDLLSDKYEDWTLLASGSLYTAPANGQLIFGKRLGAATAQFIQINNGATGYTDTLKGDVGNELNVSANAIKGDVFQVNYNASGDTTIFRFIYAQGNGSLYFYVGETVQNANLINAGRIEEKLVNKAEKTEVDGQWVSKYEVLMANITTAGTYSFDLTENYLPNDGYLYEVMCVIFNINNVNGTNSYLQVTTDFFDASSVLYVASDNNLGGVPIVNYGILPVKRYLTCDLNFQTTSNAIRLYGYRRLGTNV